MPSEHGALGVYQRRTLREGRYMSEIRHEWLDKYFNDRPQLPKPCKTFWGYDIPQTWKNVVEKLLCEERHMTVQTYSKEEIDRLVDVETALKKLLSAKGDHMTACDRTMGTTHPCTCGADHARSLLDGDEHE